MVSGRYLLVITNRRDDPTRRISTMTRTIAAVALAASALVGMTGLSQAQGLRAPAGPLHHQPIRTDLRRRRWRQRQEPGTPGLRPWPRPGDRRPGAGTDRTLTAPPWPPGIRPAAREAFDHPNGREIRHDPTHHRDHRRGLAGRDQRSYALGPILDGRPDCRRRRHRLADDHLIRPPAIDRRSEIFG